MNAIVQGCTAELAGPTQVFFLVSLYAPIGQQELCVLLFEQ